ncbi:MAG: HD family hydrolase [Euryarchaeota archaeon]|nr:HD family hydrolase [Euryarchaeota archaeon]
MILDFLLEAGKLKYIKRSGWIISGVDGESVADHCFRVALLSMLLGDRLKEQYTIDMEKLLRIAILHDIAESKIGDIPYESLKYIGEKNKRKAEKGACKDLLTDLVSGDDYYDLWEEFEERESVEAKIVRAADKLEMMIQCYEYEKQGYSLDRFWKNEDNFKDFEFDIVKEIFEELKKRRKNER